MDQSPSYREKNSIAQVLMAEYLQKKTFSEQCPYSSVIKQQGKAFYQRGIKARLIKEENFQGDNIFSNDLLFKVVNRIMTVLTIRKYNAFQMYFLR